MGVLALTSMDPRFTISSMQKGQCIIEQMHFPICSKKGQTSSPNPAVCKVSGKLALSTSELGLEVIKTVPNYVYMLIGVFSLIISSFNYTNLVLGFILQFSSSAAILLALELSRWFMGPQLLICIIHINMLFPPHYGTSILNKS